MAAPDFYFALNATFRFIYEQWGENALREYWQALGREHYAPLAERFRTGGLPEVAAYWREMFTKEPGAQVQVTTSDADVLVEVMVCPALLHLSRHGREVMPLYCEHCREVSATLCQQAGMTVVVEGGGGRCRQTFALAQVRS